ncbi:MAG: helix-turn-helix domain-containing protein [Clostridiales bacterium]|nr:helix-turn-helix domain-containing protein [Clostridiales bacterium]
MTFGENLQFLRKRSGMTQEELAEKMEVSRQSVSKWESNAAYPEMDAILRLCGLFSCDMDTLLRGDVSRRFGEDAAAYDQHMNRFSAAIAAGVALVLLGVIFSMLLVCFFASETAGGMVFFLFLIFAVTIFIVSGMNHDIFLRQHSGFVPCYTKEEMDRFERRFPFLIAIPVALILAGLLVMIPMDMHAPLSFSKDQWDALLTTLFLLCVTIAVTVLVWAGIQHSKYGFPEEKMTPAERRVGRVWGFGMVAATALYVGLGLGLDLWEQAAPIIYTVAALLCVAVTILVKKDDEP